MQNDKQGQAKRALIVSGGWEGHQPFEVADVLAGLLREEGFEVERSTTLDSFLDAEKLEQTDLIVPNWTQGTVTSAQLNGLLKAVHENGTGLAGLHGGMGDAFRDQPEYQFMCGGQWVAHPGNDGVTYTVRIDEPDHIITSGLSDFTVKSEKYYMHVDPAIHVLATTDFGDIRMPVAWTKSYGKGKVFYCSLGHQVNIVKMPEVLRLMRRGMAWAAR